MSSDVRKFRHFLNRKAAWGKNEHVQLETKLILHPITHYTPKGDSRLSINRTMVTYLVTVIFLMPICWVDGT